MASAILRSAPGSDVTAMISHSSSRQPLGQDDRSAAVVLSDWSLGLRGERLLKWASQCSSGRPDRVLSNLPCEFGGR